jgi:D-hexose-6-phosphate mutarotase
VVWNPWADHGLADLDDDGWRHMLCIESANAADNALHLQPHAAHVMETTISLEALS